MKVKLYKRLAAYLIDILLVILAVHLVSPVLPTFGDTKKIAEDYESLFSEVTEKKIESDEFNAQYIDLMYRSSKSTYLTGVLTICAYLGYFVIMPVYTKGRTAGKKLMHLQLVSDSGDDLNLNQLLLRGSILYGIPINIINQILILAVSKNMYFNATNLLSSIFTMVSIVSLFMIFLRKDQKGLHDLAANTKVISVEDSEMDSVVESKPKTKSRAVNKTKSKVESEVNDEKFDRTRNSKKRKSREN